MFKDTNIALVIDVTTKLLEIVSNKHIASSRAYLTKYSKELQPDAKDVFDRILSYALQYKGKQPIARYNQGVAEVKHLEVIDNLLVDFNRETFYRLPHIMQKVIYLCSSILIYRMSEASIRKLLTKYYPLEIKDYTVNTCKRCYTETTSTLCLSCITKIEKCVEFINESFTTTGTTVESFEYYFKDWQVVVNSFGEYKFNRLDESAKQYQPNLGIKEYQNFSSIIG